MCVRVWPPPPAHGPLTRWLPALGPSANPASGHSPRLKHSRGLHKRMQADPRSPFHISRSLFCSTHRRKDRLYACRTNIVPHDTIRASVYPLATVSRYVPLAPKKTRLNTVHTGYVEPVPRKAMPKTRPMAADRSTAPARKHRRTARLYVLVNCSPAEGLSACLLGHRVSIFSGFKGRQTVITHILRRSTRKQ